jgi:hypothetical protein
MSKRAGRSLSVIGFLLLMSACASHAPTVECDKHLAPINVGESPNMPPPHKYAASAARPTS